MSWMRACVVVLVVTWLGMAVLLASLIRSTVSDTIRVVTAPDAANALAANGLDPRYMLPIPTVQAAADRPHVTVPVATLTPAPAPAAPLVLQPVLSSPPAAAPTPLVLAHATPAPAPAAAAASAVVLSQPPAAIPAPGPQQTMRRTLAEILPALPIGEMPPTRPAFKVSNAELPKVTVMCPICTGRRKWFPNLYSMFAHQDYPGPPLELILLDGRCAKIPDEIERSAFWDQTKAKDSRVRYEFLGPNEKGGEYPASATAIGPIGMTLGAKRNWLALNAKGDIIVTFDVDDYYGPSYVSRIVAAFLEHPNADFVKLHAWFSLGERWAYEPLRRLHDWTYIDMKADPLPWGWTYNYRRKLFTAEGLRFGDMDASEEGGFFKGVKPDRIFTFADEWFSALRIVTRFVARTTGARRCDYCGPGGNDHPCYQLPEFIALMGFGGEAKLKPWLEMWNVEH